MRAVLLCIMPCLTSCSILNNRLAELETNFIQTLTEHQQIQQTAYKQYEQDLETVALQNLSLEEEMVAQAEAARTRDNSLSAGMSLMRTAATNDFKSFTTAVSTDFEKLKQTGTTMIKAGGGILGFGGVVDLVIAAASGAGATILAKRNAAKDKTS